MAEGVIAPGQKRRDKGVQRILIEEDAIQQRVRELAADLDEIYGDETPLLIGVLTGAVTFMTDLMREMGSELKIDFMAVSSYGDDVTSSGAVRILKDLNENIEDRSILIVEDIVDSGLTLKYLLDVLQRRNPRDVKVVALLRKIKVGRHRSSDRPGRVRDSRRICDWVWTRLRRPLSKSAVYRRTGSSAEYQGYEK